MSIWWNYNSTAPPNDWTLGMRFKHSVDANIIEQFFEYTVFKSSSVLLNVTTPSWRIANSFDNRFLISVVKLNNVSYISFITHYLSSYSEYLYGKILSDILHKFLTIYLERVSKSYKALHYRSHSSFLLCINHNASVVMRIPSHRLSRATSKIKFGHKIRLGTLDFLLASRLSRAASGDP